MAPESSIAVSMADNAEKAKEARTPVPTLDEALMKTGYGRFHHLVFVSGGLCLLAVIAQTLGVAYLLPSAQCDLNLSTNDKGMLGAICFIGMIASSHLWGLLADTNGRRIILVITLFMDGVVSIVASFAHSYWLLLICRFLNGFFVCGPSAVVYAYVGEFHAINIRARIIVWFSCFIALGFLVLPGTAWLIIPQKWVWELPFLSYRSWRLFLLLCGMPSLLTSFIMLFCLPETPKFLLSKGRFEEALAVLQRMYRINTGFDPDTYPVKQLPEDEYVNRNVVGGKSMVRVVWQQTWPLFSRAYILRTAVACALQFGLYASANGMVLWLPEIFSRLAEAESKGAMGTKVCTVLNNRTLEIEWEEEQEECLLEVNTVVYFNTLITGCTNALAFLSGGVLVSIVGKRTVISIATLIAGVASGLVLLATTSTHVLTLAAIFSALTSMCISVVNSVVIDVFPTNLRAMAVCISLMMGRLGTALSSVCVGALLEIDCSALFYVMCGVTIVCALLATVLPREPKKKIEASSRL